MPDALKGVAAAMGGRAENKMKHDIGKKEQIERFMILGAESGTYYATPQKLTVDNAQTIKRALDEPDGGKTVAEIVADISTRGRAPKQSPTMFALAMMTSHENTAVRTQGYKIVSVVCRIPTHLFEWLVFHKLLGGNTGAGFRRAVKSFYDKATPYQLTKYRQREGWTNRDVLRLAHLKPKDDAQSMLFEFVVKGELGALDGVVEAEVAEVHGWLTAFRRVSSTELKLAERLSLIAEHNFAWEHLPSECLNEPEVWKTFINGQMPVTAMLRNLGKMTSIGALGDLTRETKVVVARLTDVEVLKKGRVHPYNVLLALMTYRNGKGVKGSLTWNPVGAILAALEKAFDLAFEAIPEITGNIRIALDVSGSMGQGILGGPVIVSAAAAGAVMAMVIARRCLKGNYAIMGFAKQYVDLKITSRMTLADVERVVNRHVMGATDCAQPMIYSTAKREDVDAFLVITDCETWAGKTTPTAALNKYRAAMNKPNAKLVVMGMTSTGFSIADPADPNTLDVVGFDAAAPGVVASFVNNEL